MTIVQSFYDQYHQKNGSFSKLIKKNNFTYFYILQFLHLADMDRFISGKRVLDVGCGVGTLALYLSQLAQKVVGIDVSNRAIKIANNARRELGIKNVEFIPGVLKDKIGQFDLIVCTEVIEHIGDDLNFLQILKKNLKKNGYLFLTTPSRQNFLFKIGFYNSFDQQVGHLRRYTAVGLQSLLENNGFKIIMLRQVEGPLRNLLFTTRLGVCIKFIRGPLVPMFHVFDHLSVRFFGAADIQVLAQKL